ncbi:MAG: hypothetical protein IT386_02865 [Deltaproteobacteria bacterium]|nr:hypothetical protein [Deltaproteobacteria bacterium]
MRRWLAIALALAVTAAGAALAWRALRSRSETAIAGPHADIDSASRAALEKILEEADRREARETPAREPAN